PEKARWPRARHLQVAGPQPRRYVYAPFRADSAIVRAAGNTERREAIMARLVMKFGGTSVADIERIRNVARHVKREVDAGHEVAVVVSAMAGAADQLVAWCEAALKERRIFDAREYDTVVATGEQVTAGLL